MNIHNNFNLKITTTIERRKIMNKEIRVEDGLNARQIMLEGWGVK